MDPSLHSKRQVMNFLHGFSFFFKGIRFIKKHSLWSYLILPAFLSLIAAVFLIVFVFLGISEFLISKINSGNGFLSSIIHAAVWIFSAFFSFSITILLYRIIASLVVMPFLGPLLEKTIFLLHEKQVKISFLSEIKNIIYTLWVNIKFSITGLFVLIATLPLGPFQILVMIFVEGYFLGRASFDPVFESENTKIRERKKLIKIHFYEILGLGSAFFLFLMVPVIGILIAPGAALVGAAMLRHGRILYDQAHDQQ